MGDELVFPTRATEDDLGQVFDRPLPEASRLGGRHQLGHVTRERNADRGGPLGNGGEGGRVEPAVHLDEVDPGRGQRIDHPPTLRWRAGHHGLRPPDRRVAVHQTPERANPGTGKFAGADSLPPGGDGLGGGKEITDARHPVGHQLRQEVLAEPLGHGMHVHVPQPRDQELSGAGNDPRAGRHRGRPSRANGGDPVAEDHHRLIGDQASPFDIDDRDAGNGGSGGLGGRRRRHHGEGKTEATHSDEPLEIDQLAWPAGPNASRFVG